LENDMLLAATAYLANKPDGIVLAFLVVALVLFIVSAVVAGMVRAFYATAIAAGLAFFTLAFMIN
jgi:hypothetical protein